MSRKLYAGAALAALLIHPFNASAAADADLQAIREQINQLKQRHEQRIAQPEQRLQQAEANSAAPAQVAAQAASRPAAGSESAFNPAISLILSGTYGKLQQDPAIAPTGFAMSSNPGHEHGFTLGESELSISASIDPRFRGAATLALDPAGGVEVENAFVQTTALGNGFNLKFGRFFSGLGYVNEQHAPEVGWLPVILRESGNPDIAPGKPGHFEAAHFVTMLEVPARLDRAEGDVHAAGNPHIQPMRATS